MLPPVLTPKAPIGAAQRGHCMQAGAGESVPRGNTTHWLRSNFHRMGRHSLDRLGGRRAEVFGRDFLSGVDPVAR